MANLIKGVESTAEIILPFERDEFHAYIRTNIVRIDEPDTEEMPGKHCWQYDEEVLTHSEYMSRLEEKNAQLEEANITTMVGLAELYETFCNEEVV